MSASREAATEIYDIELLCIEAQTGRLHFSGGHQVQLARIEELRWWNVGEVGVLRLGRDLRDWGFRPYPDQRLRRVPERDEPADGRWAWRLGDDYIVTKRNVVPGKGGAVIPQDAESITFDLPREFLNLCLEYRQTPEGVLRGFIADLCSLQNYIRCPREDGYTSLGSDERRLAQEYFHRAYDMFLDVPPHDAA